MSVTFSLDKFLADPSTQALEECKLRKDDWIGLAKHYNITVRASWKKAKIANEVLNQLVSKEILDESSLDLCEDSETDLLAIRKLELEFERVRLEAELKMEAQEAEREAERKEREREAKRKFQMEMLQKKISTKHNCV